MLQHLFQAIRDGRRVALHDSGRQSGYRLIEDRRKRTTSSPGEGARKLQEQPNMYLAMNRFTVPLENAAAFEDLWLSRDSRLQEMDGFVAFHMLKGPEDSGRVLYASHTVWESEEKFRAWTRSEEFRAAHARAGGSRALHEGTPRFEGFQSIQEILAAETL
jgi:heme-degrading monooxygenase HmoA